MIPRTRIIVSRRLDNLMEIPSIMASSVINTTPKDKDIDNNLSFRINYGTCMMRRMRMMMRMSSR
jgi:hypothetical protein